MVQRARHVPTTGDIRTFKAPRGLISRVAYGTAVVLVVVLALGGAGAYLFLAVNETSIPSGLASDSGCPARGIRQETNAPLPPPMRSVAVQVRDGETFTMEMPRGFFAAHLVAEGAAFARYYHEPVERPTLADGSPMPYSPPPMGGVIHWTAEFIQGWCFGQDYVGVFMAQGNGTVRVDYFAGEDAGMSLV